MRPHSLVSVTLSAAILLGCDTSRFVDPPAKTSGDEIVTQRRPSPGGSTEFATLITLPSLSSGPSEARAVNNAGTVIVGYGWTKAQGGATRAVKWTLQANGSWVITALELPANSTGTMAKGTNRDGDIAGDQWASTTEHAVFWSAAGGVTILGCGDFGQGNAISADAQVVVGDQRVARPWTAVVWRPGSCREDLPSLAAEGWSRAHAVNGDATIVGGTAAFTPSGDGVPVSWKQIAGTWQLEQLDPRRGFVLTSNSAGDLAGSVYVPCSLAGGCQRAAIWPAAGGITVLGTLGGEKSWARGINSDGEVVGGSAPASGINTGYIWFPSSGMFKLPVKGQWAAAYAVSDVRPDGTRLVVGGDAQGHAIAWVVRKP